MALTKNSQIDLNGNEMILDADADTSITADTDDQIDIKVGGTDTVVITGGAMALKGATPTLTIGDAGAEDTKIVFDGNAQDFYIGLDDSADDLVIGKGSAVGTTPAIVIDENQKVGIGDTPDLAALHVKTADSGASADSGADEFVLENSGDTGMTILSGTTSSGSIRFGDSEDNDNGIIIYNHGSTPYMRFFSNGLFFNRNAAEGEIGGIAAGVTGFSTMGRINFVAEGVAGGSQSSSIRFKTTNAATESEVMRIDQLGRLLLGTTTVNIDGASGSGIVLRDNASSLFTVESDEVMALNRRNSDGIILRFRNDGSSVGTISTGSNSLPSDRNFKRNIEDLEIGLDLIKKLKPSQYNYKIQDDDAPKLYGLIAQDLEQSLAEVGVEKNSTSLLQHNPNDDEKESDYDLDYLKLTPVLINAIQEQQEQIEALQSEINTLKGG
jgi:hypothetical protein